MRVVVIGLDGCCWNFLEEWIDQGYLPAIKKVRDNGAWGDMESCLPPVTSPNWKCYSTGLNPGKLGVFWWDKVDFRNKKIVFPRSTSYEGKEIWDYLGRSGKKVCVVNMPSTHPPKNVNGILITGPPDGDESGFTYPPALEQALKKEYNYHVCSRFMSLIESDKEKAVNELQTLINLRFKVARDLFMKHSPDFLHISIFYINALQHFFGKDECVLQTWRMIDKNIEEMLMSIDDSIFIFMSDHGTNDIKWKFNISTWLHEEGYLFLRKNHIRDIAFKLGIKREKVAGILARLGLKDLVKKYTSAGVRQWLPNDEGVAGSLARGNVIDWEKTRVIPSGQGPVYINPLLSEHEIEKIKEELREKLMELTAPDGTKIARELFTREEIYTGRHLSEAPHLIIDQADGIHITPSIGFKNVFDSFDRWYSENHKIGLFMAYGNGIKPGIINRTVKITDIAPTILHLYDNPIPGIMDGVVLKEIFEPSSPYFKNIIQSNSFEDTTGADDPDRNYEYAETAKIAERLKSLGYLD